MLPKPRGPTAGTPEQHDHERALAARVHAGDEAAFSELFRTYYPALCTYVYGYVQSGSLAEELVMDVFRRIWEGRERWLLRTTVRAYLFSAARNAAIGHLRHRHHEERLARTVDTQGQQVPALGQAPGDPAERVEQIELAASIARIVDELPERCRAVVLLWWQHDLKYAEIAAALGISIKTVESHLARAAKVLRTQLAIFRS